MTAAKQLVAGDPAGRSNAAPAGSPATSCFAAVTQALPGPKILSTLGIEAVPYAIAAIACAPPTLKTVSTPHNCAATRTAALARPSRFGGVHSTRCGQFAIRAGTASITTADGSGAEPAGTYRPTAAIGRMIRSHFTPGMVSICMGCGICAAWNRCTLSMARSIAATCSRVSASRAAANSDLPTANSSTAIPSSRCV